MNVLSYLLAVDLGTTRTAASTARSGQDGGIITSAFSLGRSNDSAPSTIFVADGELLFGEAAERRGLAQPERLVREFKRRIGDDVPIVVGDQRFAPEELYARMVGWVVDAVAEREGHQPSAICVTRPVTWGAYRSGLVATALAREVSSSVELITEPEAAARHYETTSPLETGQAIAVYDLGGGTFDAVLLRKAADGTMRPIGEPTGLPDFGGADFDDLVLRHVIAAAGLSAADLSAGADSRVALAALRRECVEAKEALSFDSEAVVPVLVGQSHTTVRITRAEFEGMIEEGVERTIDVLGGALDAAAMKPTDLEAILLTGGSSRIPRIAQLLSERFDRPIAIDADPKAIVALGAARELGDRRDAAATAAATAVAIAAPAAAADAALVPTETGDGAALVATAAAAPGALALPAPPRAAEETARRRWFGRVPVTAAIAGSAMVLAGGIVLAGATGLGNGLRTAADPAQLTTDWLGFPIDPASAPDDSAQTAVALDAAPTTPQAGAGPSSKVPSKAPVKHSKKPSSAKETTRTTTTTTTTTKTEETRPSRIPAADAPRPDSTTQPSTPPVNADPDPEPTTNPEPEPSTGPDPEPQPTTDPDPEPTTDPTPEPTTDPTPEPTSDPTPEPEPTTDPTPEPEPEPEPEPTTEPEPEPTVAPEPEPTQSAPAPDPTPTDPVGGE